MSLYDLRSRAAILLCATAIAGGLWPITAMAMPKTTPGTVCRVCTVTTREDGTEIENCIEVACSKITIARDVAGASCSDSAGHKGVVSKPGVCKLEPESAKRPPRPAQSNPNPPLRHIGIKPGGAHPALSDGDCRNLGGTVVVVTDGRCGASGRYCHMNDGNAACIDTLDKPR